MSATFKSPNDAVDVIEPVILPPNVNSPIEPVWSETIYDADSCKTWFNEPVEIEVTYDELSVKNWCKSEPLAKGSPPKLPICIFPNEPVEVIELVKFVSNVILPLTNNEPVISCLSSIVSPNFVEPLSNITDDETTSVWNSCAVTEPDVEILPSTCSVANDAVSAFCKKEPVFVETT